MNRIKIVKFIVRLLVGLMFVAAAVMKLFSLDEFEVYIYSFNLFNFFLSSLAARLVIASELILGALLIAKIGYKKVWWLMQMMLSGFVCLLIYVALFRDDSNCHCFGEFVELNPVFSIAKNLVTMALLCVIYKEEDYFFKGKNWVTVAVFVLGVVVPFVLFMPDAFYNKIKNPNDKVNVTYYEKVKVDSAFCDLQLDEGVHLVGFFASGCSYCKMSLKKVNVMMDKYGISRDKFKFYIWGNDESIKQFKEETSTLNVQHCAISPLVAINITSGVFPVYALVKNGRIVKSFDYRGLDEMTVVNFLKAD